MLTGGKTWGYAFEKMMSGHYADAAFGPSAETSLAMKGLARAGLITALVTAAVGVAMEVIYEPFIEPLIEQGWRDFEDFIDNLVDAATTILMSYGKRQDKKRAICLTI